MKLNDYMLGLNETIKASSEFFKLQQVKDIISENPALKKALEEFSIWQKQLLDGVLSSKEVESTLRHLSTKFESLSKIPEVDTYINALNDFNQMMLKFYNKMNESL